MNDVEMRKGNAEVSLIIPTFNKASRLRLVLESINKLEYEEEFEVVIVNDGSNDDTEALLNHYECETRNFSLRIISIKNSGRSYARNIGIQSSTGRLVVFTDDDLILDSKFLVFHTMMHKNSSNLVVHGQFLSLPQIKFFKNPSTGELYNGETAKPQLMSKVILPEMISSSEIDIYLQNNSKISKFEKDIMVLYKNTSMQDSYVRWVGFIGGNISILKSNIESIGLFDTNMGREWGCEDLEVGYRLYRKGMSFIYFDKAKNYHLNHFRDNFTQIHNKSLSYFIEKHNDNSVKLLNKYFSGEYASLIDWKKEVDKTYCKNKKQKWIGVEMKDRQNFCMIGEYRINSIPVLFVENSEVKVKKVVFLFHKLLNNKVTELPLAYTLAKNGYFVVVLDTHGHGERAESYDKIRKYEFNNLFRDIFNTANDVHIIIDYLKKNKAGDLDLNNMSTVGVSMGGSVALVAGYLIDEIKHIASIVGTSNWDYIINNKTLGTFRFHACSNPVMDYEKAKEFAKEYNPLNNKYNEKNMKKIIFLNGMLDTTVPITIAMEYFNKLKDIFSLYGKKENLEFKTYSNAGHEMTLEMTNDLIKWLGKINTVE